MTDDYKTLRVPEDAWETAKAQKEEADRTWGEQIVRPDDDAADDIPEGLRALTEMDPERVQAAIETVEERTGRIERQLEEMQGR